MVRVDGQSAAYSNRGETLFVYLHGGVYGIFRAFSYVEVHA
jgi:hypothetical protein